MASTSRGNIVSTVAMSSTASASFDSDVNERSAFRVTGWLIAISATTVLWGAIGIGVWSVASLLN